MNAAPRTRRTAPAASLGLLILRVALGVIFFLHGWQKIFVDGIDVTTQGFGMMGVPLHEVVAPLTAYTELIGGVALALGLLTRIAAVGLTIVALGALFLVHVPNGFFAANGGFEFPLLLAAAAVTLVVAGPGAASLDAAIWPRLRRR
ncbi:DoxX family protein [Microbacterium sp. G2-8]|uniref:DoxX family protein n=1 Tax=Microbacterium sp. G2-8 TaxID=2842454 RepID=UPI001C8AE0EE|nr:DoxX family protein [Microbacterium sp. G2-8]